MPTHLKRCVKCRTYTIQQDECNNCKSSLENVQPPRFSLQDKFQNYRIDYFKEKMKKKYPNLKDKQ